MLIALKLRSQGYIIYSFHITYMSNLHMFNHYNVKAFTHHAYHLSYVPFYIGCHDIFYIHGVIWYMYAICMYT